jgi:hypothetical protein
VIRLRLQSEASKFESEDSEIECNDSDHAFDKEEEADLDNQETSMDLADHRKFDDWISFWPKLFGDKLKSFNIYERACLINPPMEGLRFEVNDMAS